MGRGRGAAEKRVGTGREDWVGAETRLGGAGGGAGGDPGSAAAGPRGEARRVGRKSWRQKFSEPGGSRSRRPGTGRGGVGAARHSHNACWALAASARPAPSPPRCCAAAAWPLLRGVERGRGVSGCGVRAAAGWEPGAERDPEPRLSTSRRRRRRPSPSAPLGPARRYRPPPARPPRHRPAPLKEPGPTPAPGARTRRAHVRRPPGLCPSAEPPWPGEGTGARPPCIRCLTVRFIAARTQSGRHDAAPDLRPGLPGSNSGSVAYRRCDLERGA